MALDAVNECCSVHDGCFENFDDNSWENNFLLIKVKISGLLKYLINTYIFKNPIVLSEPSNKANVELKRIQFRTCKKSFLFKTLLNLLILFFKLHTLQSLFLLYTH